MKSSRVSEGASGKMAAKGCDDAYLTITGRTLKKLETDLSRHYENPEEPEAVHDVRVDIRVLTSILYLFLPLIKESSYETADRMLKDTIGAFGDKRESDMLVKSLRDFVREHPEHGGKAEEAIEMVRAGSLPRREDRELIQEKMKVIRDMMVSLELTDEAKGDAHFDTFAKERLCSMLQGLRSGASQSFGKKRRIHKYRIEVKKALYSLELAEEDRDLGGAIWRARLKAVQDTAGSIHDAEVNMKLAGELNVEDREFCGEFMEFLEKRIEAGRERFMFLMKEIERMEAIGG
ncbi:CHAD domain-containing protein [Youngiibacter fragilis]|nr:CHAD domain-containing protein [Youngiibacter fragilis]